MKSRGQTTLLLYIHTEYSGSYNNTSNLHSILRRRRAVFLLRNYHNWTYPVIAFVYTTQICDIRMVVLGDLSPIGCFGIWDGHWHAGVVMLVVLTRFTYELIETVCAMYAMRAYQPLQGVVKVMYLLLPTPYPQL